MKASRRPSDQLFTSGLARLPLAEAARQMKVSRQRAHQLETQAMAKLRQNPELQDLARQIGIAV
jgi:DNA-directed RNA polymerase sigma subunit (sigma70/sigma32)